MLPNLRRVFLSWCKKRGFVLSLPNGFTLVELLIVITVIGGVFSTAVLVNTTSSIDKAKDSQRLRDIDQLKSAIETYYHDTNCYPSTSNATFSNALSDGTSWQEGSQVYMKKVPKDPSGAPYIYKTDTTTCPQWMIVYTDLSKAQTSFQSCSLPTYVISSGSCVPPGFDASFGCTSSGVITCNQPSPTPTSALPPTSSPTPTSGPGSAPSVTTLAATNVTQASVRLNASVNTNGANTNYWWQYGKTNAACSSLASFSSTGSLASGTSSVNITVSNLEGGTTYYFCAVGQSSNGTTHGTVLSFTTPALPTVSTSTATNITEDSAVVHADINTNNGGSVTYWWKYGSTETSCASLPSSTTTGSLATGSSSPSITISGLSAGATYYFCAVGQNSQGTTYGDVLSFSTTFATLTIPVDFDGYVDTQACNNISTNLTLEGSRGARDYFRFPLGVTGNALPQNATIIGVRVKYNVTTAGANTSSMQAYNQNGQANPNADSCLTRATRTSNDSSPYFDNVDLTGSTGLKTRALPSSAYTDIQNANQTSARTFSLAFNEGTGSNSNAGFIEANENTGSNQAKLEIDYIIPPVVSSPTPTTGPTTLYIDATYDGDVNTVTNACNVNLANMSVEDSTTKQRSYIRFPLNSIPAGSTITGVSLKYNVSTAGPTSSGLHPYHGNGLADPSADTCANRATRSKPASSYFFDYNLLGSTGVIVQALPAQAVADVQAALPGGRFSLSFSEGTSFGTIGKISTMESGSNLPQLVVVYNAPTPTPTPVPCDTAAVGTDQLVGCIYSSQDLSGTSYVTAPTGTVLSNPVPTTTTEIDQDWGLGGPGGLTDNFSGRWKGNFTFNAGNYTFFAGADDGVRMYIDGTLVIDQWTDGAYHETPANVTFTSTGTHQIILEYYDYVVDSRVSLRWTTCSGYQDSDGDTYGTGALGCFGQMSANNTDCNDSNAAVYQNLTGYPDSDNDTYTLSGVQVCSGASLPAGYRSSVSSPVDCYDSNALAFPGQTNYYTSNRGDSSFDYDCSGTVTAQTYTKKRLAGPGTCNALTANIQLPGDCGTQNNYCIAGGSTTLTTLACQ